MKKIVIALSAVALMASAGGTAQAATTIRVGPSQTTTIRGDVLWMRLAGDRSLLAPFALDFRGRQCWAPANVYEESCTMLVSRRVNGRRTLINGSQVAVNVRYVVRF